MFNSIGSGGCTRQDWDDLIDAGLANPPPIDPAAFEGVFSPFALTGSAFLGRGASLSLDLTDRLNPLGPGVDDDRIKALFTEIVALPEITVGDDNHVSPGPLLPLSESGSLLFANPAAAPCPPKDSGSALEATDQALRLGERKCLDDTILEPPQKRPRGAKVSAHSAAVDWHPTRNAKGSDQYTLGLGKKVWWRCKNGHEWEARIRNRCRVDRPTGCPTCSNRPGLGASPRGLVSEHPAVAEWHPTRNDKSPEEYTQGSNSSVWWQCKMGHEWETQIFHRCHPKKPRGCPTCANQPVAGSRGLVSEHQAAAEWHPMRNDKGPEEYTQGSRAIMWWQCSAGHEWQVAIQYRCKSKKTSGCPTCRSKNV